MAKRVNTERGQVKVSVAKGSLNLQIPSLYAQQYYDRKQHYLSFGARDTQENMLMAMQAALEMQRDLESGSFDSGDVDKYKHPSKRIGRQYSASTHKVEGVLELYDDFVSNIRVAKTTLATTYRMYRNYLVKMTEEQGYAIKQQLEIKSWIENNASPTTILTMLALLDRMLEWGKREDRVAPNFISKFKEYEKAYKKSLRTISTKRKPPKGAEHLLPNDGIKAWSEQERDLIIAAFHSRLGKVQQRILNAANRLDYKAYLIEFLFLVGCRHGEAFALTWGDVAEDFKKITINKSYNGACHLVKGTKTGKVRTIPVSSRVQEILRTLKLANITAGSLVFPNEKGKYFNSNMVRQLWAPLRPVSVIGKLIREKKLTQYCDAYSTRRTFISLQISKGVSVVDVAQWVGDEPETILKHYARYNAQAVPF
jgi:integrase